jgi:hypothetical protein
MYVLELKLHVILYEQVEENLSEGLKNSAEYKELLRLKSLRQEQLKTVEPDVMVHKDFRVSGQIRELCYTAITDLPPFLT